MHEQAVDVPGHPNAESTHVTYGWKVYASGYRTKWMVYNFDNAAEHTEHVLAFVSEVHAFCDASRSGLRRERSLLPG